MGLTRAQSAGGRAFSPKPVNATRGPLRLCAMARSYCPQLSRCHRVLQQHRDRERARAARHGRERAGDLLDIRMPSPTSFPFTRLTHVVTVAPGLTESRVTNPGRPIAARGRSACAIPPVNRPSSNDGSSRWCHERAVTAPSASRQSRCADDHRARAADGNLLAIEQRDRPRRARRSAARPEGRRWSGETRPRPWRDRWRRTRPAPRLADRRRKRATGPGCPRTPRRGSGSGPGQDRGRRVSAGRRWTETRRPVSRPARSLLRTYTCDAGSSPARTILNAGGRPCAAVNRATRGATSARNAAAAAMPSSFLDANAEVPIPLGSISLEPAVPLPVAEVNDEPDG